jgi:hypothetical protein
MDGGQASEEEIKILKMFRGRAISRSLLIRVDFLNPWLEILRQQSEGLIGRAAHRARKTRVKSQRDS